jgi:enoyl-CoA hydratase/carnithine racemase
MSYRNICVHHDGPTAVVTLNRPQRRNALSLELMLELIHCLDAISADRAIRAVILAAVGKSSLPDTISPKWRAAISTNTAGSSRCAAN